MWHEFQENHNRISGIFNIWRSLVLLSGHFLFFSYVSLSAKDLCPRKAQRSGTAQRRRGSTEITKYTEKRSMILSVFFSVFRGLNLYPPGHEPLRRFLSTENTEEFNRFFVPFVIFVDIIFL
uniref:Uncharacterized protein n=1 Tax=Candidatus Kentrum sp. FW TaxID=2126338 RepID=A0A450S7M7_9GAMM|nr:MAG: hypothetical protein BECKFW1821B_GA0114236_100339 [Candidatus Kentron sp. FW]